MKMYRIILPVVGALLALPVIALGATSADKATMPQLPAYAVPPTATLRLILPSTSHAIDPSTSYYSISPTGAITTGTIKPGDVVVFAVGTHAGPRIEGFTASSEAAPIMFTNDGSLLRASTQWQYAKAALDREPGPAGWPAAGGKVTFSGSSVKADKMVNIRNSKHIHFDGRGDAGTEYGFDIIGGNRMGGYYAESMVTGIWFWHCAVEGTSEAFSIKNEPSATLNRDLPNAFIQRDTQVIHCWIRNTTGREGMYLGYTSFYRYTAVGSTGYKPIEVIGITVRDCVVENAGFDGIQTTGADVEISWNLVRNSATLATAGQEAAIIANPSRGPQNIHHNTIATARRGIEFQANEGAIHHNTFVGCAGGYMLFIKLPVPADGYDQYLPDAEIAGKHLAVYNNTGQGGTTSPVWIIRDRGTCELKSNILIPSAGTCFVLSSGANAVTRRHVAPDVDADLVATSTAQPQFLSWSTDLRLTAGSSALGKGAHPVAGEWWEGGTVASTSVPLPVTYTLATSVMGGGAVARNPEAASYLSGSSVELLASPNAGYAFAGWSGDVSGTANLTAVTMIADRNVAATFTPILCTLSTSVVGNGAVAKNPDRTTYAYGEIVQLAATPAPGWRLSGWSGDITGTANQISFAMNANTNVTATFTRIAYTVDVAIAGSGSVTKSPDQPTYGYGDVVQLTATPASGYVFAGWSGDATGTTNPLPAAIGANTAITATFAPIVATVLYRIDSGGGALTLGGVAWSKDAMYSGSTSTFSNYRVTDIAGTTNDALYRTCRQASSRGGSFRYTFPVPNGSGYTVRLHFAEPFWGVGTSQGGTGGGPGKRVFDVSVEGVLKLDNYDVYADVGPAKAVVKQFANISVADGFLTIDFASVKDRAMISGIEVIRNASAARIALTMPEATSLAPNYPNPFNPATTIPFALATDGHVRLAVYDALGQEIRVLVDESRTAGNAVAIWDGRDTAGRQIASGVYLVRLATDAGVLVRRMTLVR